MCNGTQTGVAPMRNQDVKGSLYPGSRYLGYIVFVVQRWKVHAVPECHSEKHLAIRKRQSCQNASRSLQRVSEGSTADQVISLASQSACEQRHCFRCPVVHSL